jgi:hypothetical protein
VLQTTDQQYQLDPWLHLLPFEGFFLIHTHEPLILLR